MRKNDRQFMDYFMALISVMLVILMMYSVYLGGLWVGVTFLVVFWLSAFWSDRTNNRRNTRKFLYKYTKNSMGSNENEDSL